MLCVCYRSSPCSDKSWVQLWGLSTHPACVVLYVTTLCAACILTYTCSCAYAGTDVPEVDSVLATSEVQKLLQERDVDLAQQPEAPFDALLSSVDASGQLYGIHGGAGKHLYELYADVVDKCGTT